MDFSSITTARRTSRRSLPIRTYARPYSSSYAPAPIRSRLDARTGSWLALCCNFSSMNQYFSFIKQTFSSIKQTFSSIKQTFLSIEPILSSIKPTGGMQELPGGWLVRTGSIRVYVCEMQYNVCARMAQENALSQQFQLLQCVRAMP